MNEISKNNFFDYIEKLFENNVLSHAYLIEVNNYEEDYKKVLTFIKMILCSKKNKSIKDLNCNECNICELIDNDNYPDLYVIEPDGNNIKKEQILKLENEFSNYSLLDNKRIYIIKEAEKMNIASSNTILKFLEEPNDGIVAILLTNNRYKIIDTIISRCQILSLKNDYDIENYEGFELVLENLIEPDNLFINYDSISNLFIDSDKKIDKKKMRKYFEDLSIMLLNYYNNNIEDIPESLIDILNNISKEKIFNCICIIQNEINKLEFNVNNKLWLDLLFSKIIGGNL